MLFWPIFVNFWCPVVTLVTFSSSLSNFERNPKTHKKKSKILKFFKKSKKIQKNLKKKMKNLNKIQKNSKNPEKSLKKSKNP